MVAKLFDMVEIFNEKRVTNAYMRTSGALPTYPDSKVLDIVAQLAAKRYSNEISNLLSMVFGTSPIGLTHDLTMPTIIFFDPFGSSDEMTDEVYDIVTQEINKEGVEATFSLLPTEI